MIALDSCNESPHKGSPIITTSSSSIAQNPYALAYVDRDGSNRHHRDRGETRRLVGWLVGCLGLWQLLDGRRRRQQQQQAVFETTTKLLYTAQQTANNNNNRCTQSVAYSGVVVVHGIATGPTTAATIECFSQCNLTTTNKNKIFSRRLSRLPATLSAPVQSYQCWMRQFKQILRRFMVKLLRTLLAEQYHCLKLKWRYTFYFLSLLVSMIEKHNKQLPGGGPTNIANNLRW